MAQFPQAPTQVGQRVRATGYGGAVRQYMVGTCGTVVRFTSKGNPVVAVDANERIVNGARRFSIAGYNLPTNEVRDRWGCFKLIDPITSKLEMKEVAL